MAVKLPNLYVVLDIFVIAFRSVQAAAKFRSLNRKNNQFYLQNKSYLQEKVDKIFNLKTV